MTDRIRDPFSRPRPLILGVVHLLPLPGSPRYGGDRSPIWAGARRDAISLLEGGCSGIIVENFGDAPFHADRVDLVTIAEMTRITAELRQLVGEEPIIGVNVLRNDAAAALAVAGATGVDLIRVNVHTGALLTDQGWIEGKAAETLRFRHSWDIPAAIVADIGVKHAIHPPGFDIAEAARETVGRGLADALIVTGPATGSPVDPADLIRVREAVPGVPLLIGSGATAETIGQVLERADGVIVGTSLKENGDVTRPVDPARVRAFVIAAR